MSYCHYHPLTPATWYCQHCQAGSCDSCTRLADNLNSVRAASRCLHCDGPVQSLGAVHSAEPFWRKLPEAFRYPTDRAPLILIAGSAFASSLGPALPLGFIIQLIALAMVLRYCFTSLQLTAQGRMSAPSLSEMGQGGLTILMQLILLVAIMAGLVAGAWHAIGPGTAKLLGTSFTLALPAIIILFALSESLLAALHPQSILGLIRALGSSYGALLGMLMVMMASVEVLQNLLGELAWLTLFLSELISNFYMVVSFHLLGLMIFQHQGDLGFVARDDSISHERSEQSLHDARLDIALKNGEYQKLVDLFVEANQKFPQDLRYYERCFNFLCAARISDRLVRFFPHYLQQLESSNRTLQIYPAYKQLLKLLPDYQPDSARLRHLLADYCRRHGDSARAVKLLNGLNRAFPNYPKLPQAFELMAEALADLPNMDAQAAKCRALAKKLQEQAPATKTRVPPLQKGDTNPGRRLPKAIAAKADTAANTDKDDNGELPPIEFKR